MNLAKLHEAISEHFHDQECLIYGERRFSWGQFTDRTRRLATLFRSHGLGIHRERSEVENWESGQDHIALYLYNCNEYMEGLMGAYKCRAGYSRPGKCGGAWPEQTIRWRPIRLKPEACIIPPVQQRRRRE